MRLFPAMYPIVAFQFVLLYPVQIYYRVGIVRRPPLYGGQVVEEVVIVGGARAAEFVLSAGGQLVNQAFLNEAVNSDDGGAACDAAGSGDGVVARPAFQLIACTGYQIAVDIEFRGCEVEAEYAVGDTVIAGCLNPYRLPCSVVSMR